MPVLQYTKGKLEDFIAAIDFRLNFEDKTPSVMVKIGDLIQYDGETATYTKATGDKVVGRTLSLKSAVAVDWLMPKNVVEQAKVDTAAEETKEFDGLRGGSFDKAIDQDETVVTQGKKTPIIREKDMVVKETGNKVTSSNPTGKYTHLEVAGDQVDVKAVGTPVTSSTSGVRSKKFSKEVKQSEDYGATSTQPIKTNKTATTAKPEKKNSYTVDATTPRISEFATPEEIRRAKGIVEDVESQGAKVVGSVKKQATVETVDGINLRKTESPTEINTQARVGTGEVQVEAVTAKLSSGGNTSVADLSGSDPDGAVVVATLKKPAVEPVVEEKTPELSIDISKEVVEPDYLAMLPDNWAEMHWAQKEKFIKRMVNRGFLEFLIGVETSKAVQTACEERLKELSTNVETDKPTA